MDLIKSLEQEIATVTGGDFVCSNQQSIGGGCINTAFRLDGKDVSYFVKTNAPNREAMFAAEAAGLKAMADTGTIHVPKPICHGVAANQSYIVMEYLEMGGSRNASLLGEQLAAMHQHTSETFGWHIDNTIGSTPQPNSSNSDWATFWQQERLGFQLDLAKRNGAGGGFAAKGEKLIEAVPKFFADYQPRPSLIHGDLWSGNHAYIKTGEPTIFDPAVYYADREAEIAMTELFGGFGNDFYAAYNQAWALDKGYAVRKTFYNLYHIINHFNLFDGGYRGQAESMMASLLSEVN